MTLTSIGQIPKVVLRTGSRGQGKGSVMSYASDAVATSQVFYDISFFKKYRELHSGVSVGGTDQHLNIAGMWNVTSSFISAMDEDKRDAIRHRFCMRLLGCAQIWWPFIRNRSRGTSTRGTPLAF